MTCFLAEAANSFNVGTSFAKMSRISTPEAGGFLFLRLGSFGLLLPRLLLPLRATLMALLNFSSSSLSLKSVFKTASLSTEQMNLVRKASSKGSLVD